LQKELCVNKSPHESLIKPHILINTLCNKVIPFLFLNNTEHFFFDQDSQAYEVFVDEGLKDDIATYGVYYTEKCPFNLGNRVYGPQTLQNATFQGVEQVLATFPPSKNLNIYLDRESALKILNRLPLCAKDRHNAHEINMLNRIAHLIQMRSGVTVFLQVYSHLEVTPDMSTSEATLKNNHWKQMQQWYPGGKASRLKKSNEGADHMCELGYLLDEPLSAPSVTQYHNHMLLQNIAPKTSCDSPFITERFRPTT